MEATHIATVGQIIDAEVAAGRPAPSFFRELLDPISGKCYGTDELGQYGDRQRLVGFYGRKRVVLEEPFYIQRGHKIVTLNASLKRPRICWEQIYPHV